MRDSEAGGAARRLYDQAMERAMRHACRHVAWDQAFEIAHDVASELVQQGATGPDDPAGRGSFDALVYRAVFFHLRDFWRAGQRRASAEQVHQEERSGTAPSWSEPGRDLTAQELTGVIETTVAGMPEAMRDVFLLVRRDELSYKEVSGRLGIGVGTVHTHLSRASARLREAIRQYQSDASAADGAGPANTAATNRT